MTSSHTLTKIKIQALPEVEFRQGFFILVYSPLYFLFSFINLPFFMKIF